MTEPLESWVKRLGSRKLSSCAALLSATYLGYFLLTTPLAWWTAGSLGLVASGLATMVCLISGLLALVATSLVISAKKPTVHVLMGSMIRMGLPLIACLIIIPREADLAAAGFAWYLIGAYLIGLLVETVLTVGHLKLTQ